MGPYDQQHVTLDPGRTALALRALAERDGHYPFMDRFVRRRARRRAGSQPGPRPVMVTSFWPRTLRASELFPTWTRLRGMRGAARAA